MSSPETPQDGQNVTEQQHFVPKFYLRRFADSQKFLHVIDPRSKTLLPRRPYPSVCYGRFFYAAKEGVGDGISQTVEQWLKWVEDYVSRRLAEIIDKILTEQQISKDDRYVLSVLCSMLWIRGPVMRQEINKMGEQMIKESMKITAEQSVEAYYQHTGEHLTEAQKQELVEFIRKGEYTVKFGSEHHLKFMLESLGLGGPGFANLFFHQRWRIHIARGNKRFITSDNPLVEWSPPPRGFYGYAFPEREHFLALTPEILLELTYSAEFNKVKRKTHFAKDDDIVHMYNLVIVNQAHQFAYSGDRQMLVALLTGTKNPGKAEHMYYDRFIRPYRESKIKN